MCTGIRLIAENNRVIYGRTLEFTQDTESNIIVIPRNYRFSGTTVSKKPGLSWRSKYAVVGANMLHLDMLVDGVNEKGLGGGLFYLPDYAKYQQVSLEEQNNSIASWELLTWIITNFATIQEVKKALPTIKVSNTIFERWGFVPPLHAIIHEASGKSLVIEYKDGKLDLYSNSLGIITNAPGFDWHLINLSNYINLSPINAKELQLFNLTFPPLSQGTGMLGLPGDFSSPSRFVRAAILANSLVGLKTEHEARKAAFHLLNLFDISLGLVIEQKAEHLPYEYTQWTSVSDLHNKHYFWRTYQTSQLYKVDLMKMDLDAEAIKTIKMHQDELIIDVSSINLD